MVKRLMSIAVVALLAFAVLSACGTEEEASEATVTRIPNAANAPVIGSPTAQGAGGGGSESAATEVDLKMVDIAFEPKDFIIAANTEVVIHLENEGAALHNFTVEALGISEDVNPGESMDVTLNTGPGELDYYCDVPGHREAGMEGTITVAEEGAPAPGGVPPASPEGSPSSGASPSSLVSPAASDLETPAAAQGLTVDLQDIKFVPSEITVPANTPTTITLTNTGAAPHNFSIDEFGISVDVAPGETTDVEINAPAGQYKIYCDVPGHEAAGMVGTMTVQ